MADNISPLMVTIRCITYNHEPYIRQCLEGFVMQKTNFRFEAIVHDDASTDGTAAIIREYAEKYPNIIKPIFEAENQHSKRDGSLTRIMDAYMNGKYIAMCEGDDYWIDPLKLQKQVDFLEANPEYVMCFHAAVETWEDNSKLDELFSNIENRDYSGIEIFKRWIVPTASTVYRSWACKDPFLLHVRENKRIIFGDTLLFCSLSRLGRIRGMDDVMSVYRRNQNSMTFTQISTPQKQIQRAEMDLAFGEEFGGDYKKYATNSAINLLCRISYHNLTNKYGRKAFLRALTISPHITIFELAKLISNRFTFL